MLPSTEVPHASSTSDTGAIVPSTTNQETTKTHIRVALKHSGTRWPARPTAQNSLAEEGLVSVAEVGGKVRVNVLATLRADWQPRQRLRLQEGHLRLRRRESLSDRDLRDGRRGRRCARAVSLHGLVDSCLATDLKTLEDCAHCLPGGERARIPLQLLGWAAGHAR